MLSELHRMEHIGPWSTHTCYFPRPPQSPSRLHGLGTTPREDASNLGDDVCVEAKEEGRCNTW